MIHAIGPNYLNNLVPPLVQENSRYSLRNARNVTTIKCNSNLYYDSFLPSTIRDWNNLSDEIRNSQSFSIFKSKLNANRVKPPAYYNFGLRTLQIYHARLRLECSSLNFHLHKSKIVDSPRCNCGEPETTKYYLLQCPQYNIPRNQVPNDFLHMSIKTLLRGSPTLSVNENEAIFNAVQLFIARTGRFT